MVRAIDKKSSYNDQKRPLVDPKGNRSYNGLYLNINILFKIREN